LHYSNIDDLIGADYYELILVDEIGEKIAESIISYFQNPKHLEIIEQLRSFGIKMKLDPDEIEKKSNLLEEKSFVISGVFSQFSRNQLKQMIEENGGKNVSGISSKTDFLLAGANMGPKKLEKAAELGIKIISEEEFLQMIEGEL